ncbi:hypothetical protein LTR27_006635 [Elasticomyces elasticus]|nr:hypothetical protein LTR27_006635 [Elasticomyces elasticus]
MQAGRNHPKANLSTSTSDAATHGNQQVALPPHSLSLYTMRTRARRGELINFLAEPEEDELPPSQRATSTSKRSAARANFEKKVAYPLRPTRTQFKSAPAGSKQEPRPASNPAHSSLEKENAPTSPRQVLPRVSASEVQYETTTEAERHLPIGFLTIPPEIRNQIYDIVAAPEVGVVNLLTARAPTKALPFVCRQVYNEVQHLHRAAYRAFWSDTKFTVSPYDKAPLPFSRQDLANVRHLQFAVKLTQLGLGRTMSLECRRLEKPIVLERWADGRWFEFADAAAASPDNSVYCIVGGYAKGEHTAVNVVTLPRANDGPWRVITYRELRYVASGRHRPWCLALAGGP